MLRAPSCPRIFACAAGSVTFCPCSLAYCVSSYWEAILPEWCSCSKAHGSTVQPNVTLPVPFPRFILQVTLSVSPVCLLSLGSSGSHTRLSVPWEQGYTVCCCTHNYRIISVRTKCACVMLKESGVSPLHCLSHHEKRLYYPHFTDKLRFKAIKPETLG